MKRKDLMPLLVVGGLAAIVSFYVSGAIIIPSDKKESVEVVPVISTELIEPDERYFNSNSINPAQDIEVGQDPDSQPFSN